MSSVSTLVDTKSCPTAQCTICKGAGSYVDDFTGQPRVTVCTRCHNEAGLPLVRLTTPVTDGQLASIARLIVDLEELGDTEIKALVAKRINDYDFTLAAKCVAKLQLRKNQRIADKAATKREGAQRTFTRQGYPDVPAGRYAVQSRTGNNDLDFFRVDRPTEGRWEGYTFVKRIIGGHDDTAIRGAEARQALQAIIDAGTFVAGALYGQTIGKCGRCGRHLTDETSREQGYGPECITKVS
jgi:cytochrome c553